MPEHDDKGLPYIKDINAIVVGVGAAIAAAFSLWKQEFDPPFLVTVGGLIALVVLIRVYAKRDPSTQVPGTWVPRYSRSKRMWALAGAGIVVFFLAVFWFFFPAQPVVERLIPPDPIAGAPLQIFGSNLSGTAGVEVAFADARVSEYIHVDKGFVEVRVPQTATAGPLYLKSKGRMALTDRDLIYPIITIQDKGNRFLLLTEDIRPGGNSYKIKFSAVNSGSSVVMINRIQLRVVAIKDLSQVNLIRERIDLGTLLIIERASIASASKKGVNLFQQHRVELLDDRFTIQLDPQASESFVLHLNRPEGQHHLKLVFAIAISYLGGTNGGSGLVFGSRFFSLESGDLVGMRSTQDLPFNEDSIHKLQQEYGSGFIRDSLMP